MLDLLYDFNFWMFDLLFVEANGAVIMGTALWATFFGVFLHVKYISYDFMKGKPKTVVVLWLLSIVFYPLWHIIVLTLVTMGVVNIMSEAKSEFKIEEPTKKEKEIDMMKRHMNKVYN